MSTPDPYSPQTPPSSAPTWGEDSDKTTVYRPASNQNPPSGASPATAGYNPDPSALASEPAYEYPAQAYSAAPDSGATAVYPPAPAPPMPRPAIPSPIPHRSPTRRPLSSRHRR